MIPEITYHYALLDDLDARQDDVIAQLDHLNEQVESLLKTCGAGQDPVSEIDASPSLESSL